MAQLTWDIWHTPIHPPIHPQPPPLKKNPLSVCQLPFDLRFLQHPLAPQKNHSPLQPPQKCYLKGCLPLTRGIHDMVACGWLGEYGWSLLVLDSFWVHFWNILYMQSIRELVFSLIQLPIFYIECESEPPVGVILWQFRKEGSRPILHTKKNKYK